MMGEQIIMVKSCLGIMATINFDKIPKILEYTITAMISAL
jgi:hypothetical protein